MSGLGEHKLLSDRQHTSRKSHSCETKLVIVTGQKSSTIEVRLIHLSYMITLFDTSPHELLKNKLFSYGFGGKTIKWIDIFLCMNSLKTNCLVMDLEGRQLNGLIFSCATYNKRLWLSVPNETGLLLYLVSLRASFLVPF